MKHGKKWLIASALGVVALVIALLAASRRGPSGPGAAEPVPSTKAPEQVAVTVEPVTPRKIGRTVQVVGSLYGEEEVTITPKVEGRVAKILHDAGDVVKPGDVLLEIEATDHRLAVAEGSRAVEMELAKIGLQELPEGEADLAQVPTVAKARAVEENARLKVERVEKLPQGAIAREEYEERQADYRVAKTSREQVMMEARATLAAARHEQALLAIAEEKLKDTRVLVPERSPARFAGDRGALPPTEAKSAEAVEYVVAERLVSEGEMVRAFPSVPVFRLVIDNPLKLKANSPERNVGLIKVGQPVSIAVEAYPGEVFQATVSRVNPTVDRQSRTFQLEALVPNASRRLKAGSFVKATIATHVDAGALTVPEEALVTFAGITKVFVVEGGRTRAVNVQPGTRVEDGGGKDSRNWIEVTGALKAGELAVTSGHSKLAEGTPVRVRERTQDPAPGAGTPPTAGSAPPAASPPPTAGPSPPAAGRQPPAERQR